jgi:hypothetical protein
MTRRPVILALLLASVLLAPALAAAQETANPAKCFANPERWAYDRKAETLAAPGERFFEDMRACDPSFAAAITEAVRYQIHTEEAQKFTRASKYVMAAYGVAWAILAGAGLALYLRQRRLNDEIASLEAKLREAEKDLR